MNMQRNTEAKRLPYNPYIAGRPLSNPEDFFGRESIIRDVMQILRHPQDNAVVLYGQRRIGKTSVLLQLVRRLRDGGEYTPIYFDLQGKSVKPLDEVLYELAQSTALAIGCPIPERNLFDAAGVYFRQTFLPTVAKAAAPGGLVLLFDEFDVLDLPQSSSENRAVHTFFPYLQACMTEVSQVKFFFIIGRRPEDLSEETIAVFKVARFVRVSLLERKDVDALVRQSERNRSLTWSEDAIEKVWVWARGHPYITQLLCSVVWEDAWEVKPLTVPIVEAIDVDTAIPRALERGASAFHWIWAGLPPAEKVVIAAMAEAGDEVISKDKLIEILNRIGVRLIFRQLQLAPDTLIEWELFRRVDNGYHFVVPLIRHWVKTNQPLRRVKDELDMIDPRADMLFRAGLSFYSKGEHADAEELLRKALQNNPNHLKARLLLGNIFFERAQITEAIDILQQAYEYDQEAAKEDLIKALLKQAVLQTDDDQQLSTYEHVLRIDPNHPIARDKRRAIWKKRGETCLQQQKWDDALAAFQEADDATLYDETQRRKHRYEFESLLNQAAQYEKNEDWNAAIRVWELLIKDYSDLGDLLNQLRHAKEQASLEQRYKDALIALQNGDTATAQHLLAGVISLRPDYKNAALFLLQATKGVDGMEFMLHFAMHPRTRILFGVLIGALAGLATFVVTTLLGNITNDAIKSFLAFLLSFITLGAVIVGISVPLGIRIQKFIQKRPKKT